MAGPLRVKWGTSVTQAISQLEVLCLSAKPIATGTVNPLCHASLSTVKPPLIQNGYIKGKFWSRGQGSLFCNEGYELIGDHSWTCLKSGKWSKKPNQKCVPAKCPEPPLLENQQLVLKELTTEWEWWHFPVRKGVLQGRSVLRCLRPSRSGMTLFLSVRWFCAAHLPSFPWV